MNKFDGIQTYRASCRCGAVRYEADADLGKGTSQCNCTFCTKLGWWGLLVKPSAFRLLSGEESLLRSPDPRAERPRCAICGVIPFGHGNVPQIGGEYYSINIRCIDGVDLAGVPIKYLDGRHDTWALLAEAPYANPFVGAGAPGNKPAWEE
jgi:hypothetical protein